jgi:RNA polymerase sigma factor (sigma-70 family)
MRRCPDRELLQRFLGERCEAAFEALLRRHGPMVLDVCRGVLGNEADAEDAVQTTFLILARKGQSIRKTRSLASWLHGVACRTALKARADSARRHKHEDRAGQDRAARERAVLETPDDVSWREFCQILHQELSGLSERHRTPLVLCYLEGKTLDEAAGQLSLPKGTLKGHLERGRARLRARLVRRGFGPAGVLAAATWPAATARAGLPPAMAASTIQAAITVVAGGEAASVVSVKVAGLMRGVLSTMALTKLKLMAGLLLGFSVVGVGAAVLGTQQLPASQEPLAQPAVPVDQTNLAAQLAQLAVPQALKAQRAKEEQKEEPRPADKERPEKTDAERLRGAWAALSVEQAGGPWPGRLVEGYGLVFGDGKVTFRRAGSGSIQYTLKLDEAAKPKTIDWTLGGVTCLGIYRLNGDILKLCVSGSKENRPTEFATREGSGHVLLLLKRVREVRPRNEEKASRSEAKKPTRIVVPAALVNDGKVTDAIISINPDTGAWKRLTGAGLRPRVSPDGQAVVFIRDDAIWNCDTGGSDNPGKLFEWSSYGGPVWSPDGKHLYCTSLQAALDNNLWRHETWQRDADGGNPVKLRLPLSEAILDVSRDGKHCLTRSRLITRLNSSALMLMKLDGTSSRTLSAPGGFNEPARFAPDGKRVAYCRNDRDGFSVWTVKEDGKDNRKVLGEAGVFVEACCWCPEGRRLAVVAADLIPVQADGKTIMIIPYRREQGHWRIDIMDADGQNRIRLPLKANVRSLRDPDWQRFAD